MCPLTPPRKGQSASGMIDAPGYGLPSASYNNRLEYGVRGKIPYSVSRIGFLSSLINTTVLARRAGPLIEKGEEGAESLEGKQIPPDDPPLR